jgi:hypothetical protein
MFQKPTALLLSLALLAGCSPALDDGEGAAAGQPSNDVVTESRPVLDENIPSSPEDILRQLHLRGELFEHRRVWPRDVPFQVEMAHWWKISNKSGDLQLPNRIDVYDCHSRFLYYQARHDNVMWGRPTVTRYIDAPHRRLIVLPVDCDKVNDVQLYVHMLDNVDHNVDRYPIALTMPVTFTDSVHDILEEHVDHDYYKQLVEMANTNVVVHLIPFDGWLRITLPLLPGESSTVVALDIDMYVEGEWFHTAQVLCGRLCHAHARKNHENERRIMLEVNGDYRSVFDRLESGGSMTLKIRANPELALLDFQAERVWSGEEIVVEMEMSVEDSANWLWTAREAQ